MNKTARSTKLILLFFFSMFVVMLGSGFLMARNVVRGGLMHVSIHDKGEGTRISTVLPAFFLSCGTRSVSIHGCDVDLDRWRPAIAAATNALQTGPDGRLLEIEDDDAHVTIDKVNGMFVIHIDDDHTEVSVKVPVSGLNGLKSI